MVGLRLKENNKKMRFWTKYKRGLLWLLAIGWMGIIFYFSHQPATESSELSAGITQYIFGIIQILIPVHIDMSSFHTFIRKAAHFSAYFLLGSLIYAALGQKRNRWIIALGFATLYAVSDELHQLFIPGRSGEIRDVFIDSLGATVGIVSTIILLRFLPSSKQ